MDPGPFKIGIYPEQPYSTSFQRSRELGGIAYLAATKYVHALKTKGWRMSRKFNIQLDEADDVILHHGGIISTKTEFRMDRLIDAPSEACERMFLETIHKSMLRCCSKFDWPEEVLHLAYQRCISHLGPVRLASKWFRSSDRQHYARLISEMGPTNMALSVLFADKHKQTIRETSLIICFQHAFLRQTIAEHMGWTSPTTFGIWNSTSEIRILASMDEDHARTEIIPERTPLAELEGTLRSVTYRSFSSPEEIATWVQL